MISSSYKYLNKHLLTKENLNKLYTHRQLKTAE